METNPTRYYQADLESALEQKFIRAKELIVIAAVAHAEKLAPPLSNEDLSPYYKEHHLQYEQLLIMVNTAIQSTNLENNRQLDNQRTKDDVAELQNKLVIAKEQNSQRNTNLTVSRPYSPLRPYAVWGLMGVLCLFEGILNRQTFSAYGFNLLEASLMSLAFAALLLVFAHTFEANIKKGHTVSQRRAIAIIQSASLITVFWFFATVRAKYLSDMVADNSGNTTAAFSPVPITLLSTLIFAASVLICHFFAPSKAERQTMRDFNDAQKAAQAREAHIAELEAAIDAKETANEKLNAVHNSLQEEGAMVERRIIGEAKLGLEIWKKHNALHRSDGRPKSFDTNEYPFKFQTFFSHT